MKCVSQLLSIHSPIVNNNIFENSVIKDEIILKEYIS
jgi:hypothetical protein